MIINNNGLLRRVCWPDIITAMSRDIIELEDKISQFRITDKFDSAVIPKTLPDKQVFPCRSSICGARNKINFNHFTFLFIYSSSKIASFLIFFYFPIGITNA